MNGTRGGGNTQRRWAKEKAPSWGCPSLMPPPGQLYSETPARLPTTTPSHTGCLSNMTGRNSSTGSILESGRAASSLWAPCREIT